MFAKHSDITRGTNFRIYGFIYPINHFIYNKTKKRLNKAVMIDN